MMVIILFLLVFITLFHIVDPAMNLNFSSKLFRVTFFAPCEPSEKYPIRINRLEFAKKAGKANIYKVAAAFNVTEKIYEPIEVIMSFVETK